LHARSPNFRAAKLKGFTVTGFLGHHGKNLSTLPTYGHQICAAGASDVGALTGTLTPV